jgi:hypothetical protein
MASAQKDEDRANNRRRMHRKGAESVESLPLGSRLRPVGCTFGCRWARKIDGCLVAVPDNMGRTLVDHGECAIQLLPVPVRKSLTVSYQLNDGDGTCSDGTQSRPCHIVALPVHNGGSLEATVTWPVAGPALALILFESGSPVPLARSTPIVDGNAHFVTDVDGGAVYEIRVIYASGKGAVTYSLSVAYPN